MDFSLGDLGSLFSKGECKDNNKIFLWILVLAIICCCASKNGIGGCESNNCGTNAGTGSRSGIICIIVILLILGGGGNGILPLGNDSGNTNTNIIKLDREAYEDDYI